MSRIDRRSALQYAAGACMPLWGAKLLGQTPPVQPKVEAKVVVDPYADAKFVDGPPPLPEKGSFTIAALPDTQHYSEKFPKTYLAQTQWILDNKEKRNIAAVLHLGDITNKNSPPEWKNAAKAMSLLDGQVPYFFTTGNHDYGAGGGCKDRTTGLHEHFPAAKYRKFSTFGGTYDKEPDQMENHYGLFSAGGRDFLVLALEFGPRADVVRWANEVVAKHAKREAILVTHAFVYNNSRRYDWAKYHTKQTWNPHNYAIAKPDDDVTDGQELWDKLISKHENFIFTINGHVLGSGLGRLVSKTPAKRDVHQMLVNFQMKPKGGDGWLRLLQFRPDHKSIDVIDYSMTRDQCNVAVGNKFTMTSAPVKTA